MSRSKFHLWVLHRLVEDGPLTAYQLVARGPEKKRNAPGEHLHELESRGLIQHDPSTFTYDLTNEGRQMILRRRAAAAKHTAAPAPVNLEAAKEQLIVDMHGPHGLAIATCEDDPVLSERLQIAIADGMPPVDLRQVPKYKRAEYIDTALLTWRQITREGPCGFCGCRAMRRSGQPVSIMDDATSIPGFSNHHGQKACAWCADHLVSGTVDEFRERIFNAVAGTLGLPVIGNWRSAPVITPFFFEIPSGTPGEPWGHFTEVHKVAMRLRAQKVVHKSRFIRSEEHARLVSVPGIKTHVWSEQELPSNATKGWTPLADLRRHRNEQEALEARIRKAAQQKELHAARRAEINERNAALYDPANKDEAELREWAKANGIVL